MRLLMIVTVALALSACTQAVVVAEAFDGSNVWFAEVQNPTGRDRHVRIILCNAAVHPPCVRFMPKNAESSAELTQWRAASAAATRAAATPPPVSASPDPTALPPPPLPTPETSEE